MSLAPLLLASCLGPHEGDDPGECADGADNDRNGYFDCVDLGCHGSPDCEDGGATQTNPTNPTDPGTDSGTDPTDTPPTTTSEPLELADYASYAVTMVVTWSFPTKAFPDCLMIYEGSGASLASTPVRVTFDGPYTRSYTTCTDHAVLESAFPWYDAVTNEALVTFKFTSGLAQLDEWFADPSETQQGQRAEWRMFDMAEDYDPALLFVHHNEGYVDPGGTFIVEYDIEATFSP